MGAGPARSARYRSTPFRMETKTLEDLLQSIDRPGDFFTHDRLLVPMPVLEVDGVGSLSFPVPDVQVRALIEVAERAPYGKGTETLVDTSVRDCWQIDAARVRLGGRAWPETILGNSGRDCDRSRLPRRTAGRATLQIARLPVGRVLFVSPRHPESGRHDRHTYDLAADRRRRRRVDRSPPGPGGDPRHERRRALGTGLRGVLRRLLPRIAAGSPGPPAVARLQSLPSSW